LIVARYRKRKGSETRMEGKARFVFPVVIAIGWPIATSTAYVAMPFARSLTQRIVAAIERTV